MFSATELSKRIMRPQDMRMVRTVFKRIVAESNMRASVNDQRDFARFLLRMYFRGLVVEDKLYEIGVAAAKARFKNGRGDSRGNRLPVSRVLIVEDDYLLAADMRATFEKAGATVLGPVSRERDATELIKIEVPDLAIIDLNLGDGPVFGVADELCRQHVPVCIHSACARAAFRELPESLHGVPWVQKATDLRGLVEIAERTLN